MTTLVTSAASATPRRKATRKPQGPALRNLAQLSFVDFSGPPGECSHWHMPPPPDVYVEAQRVYSDGSRGSRDTALYHIGCEQGRAAAYEFLRLPNRRSDLGLGSLHYLVLGMLDAPRGPLLRGQVVGFFHTLEKEALA